MIQIHTTSTDVTISVVMNEDLQPPLCQKISIEIDSMHDATTV